MLLSENWISSNRSPVPALTMLTTTGQRFCICTMANSRFGITRHTAPFGFTALLHFLLWCWCDGCARRYSLLCCRGLGADAHEGETEEAEYAWLPVDALRSFEPGQDGSVLNPEGQISGDTTLRASVEAAARAVLLSRSDAAAGGRGTAGHWLECSDSDGGAASLFACLNGVLTQLIKPL